MGEAAGAAGIEASPAMSALVRAQPGAWASVTLTSVRVESPSLITWIVKETALPARTTCSSGVFEIEMCGLITTTSAESLAVTSPPAAGVPVAVAVLVKLEVTPASEQVYETLSPGAKVLLSRLTSKFRLLIGVTLLLIV